MADNANEGAEPTASAPKPKKKAVAKKKTAKQAASKKIVAKKGTKKKAAKQTTAKRTTKKASAALPASEASRPAPAPVTSEPSPVWDDDPGERGLVGLLIQWGPVLLLILLIWVLGGRSNGEAHASRQPDADEVAGPAETSIDVLSVDSGLGAGRRYSAAVALRPLGFRGDGRARECGSDGGISFWRHRYGVRGTLAG